jgi:hypothetical protein
VTVLIPAHNAGAFLREAVDSILGQTFTDFECLVIDDGSTDGAVEALRAIADPRLRIERNPRNLPCPTCKEPNRLTPADARLGYQCDECADREEGAW